MPLITILFSSKFIQDPQQVDQTILILQAQVDSLSGGLTFCLWSLKLVFPITKFIVNILDKRSLAHGLYKSMNCGLGWACEQ